MCRRVRELDHCEYVPNPLNTTLDYCECNEEEIWWVQLNKDILMNQVIGSILVNATHPQL